MSYAEEPGIGCFHCDYLGWRTRDVRVSRPEDVGCITEPCPYCSPPSDEPEWFPSEDDWGMADDSDQEADLAAHYEWEERIG